MWPERCRKPSTLLSAPSWGLTCFLGLPSLSSSPPPLAPRWRREKREIKQELVLLITSLSEKRGAGFVGLWRRKEGGNSYSANSLGLVLSGETWSGVRRREWSDGGGDVNLDTDTWMQCFYKQQNEMNSHTCEEKKIQQLKYKWWKADWLLQLCVTIICCLVDFCAES